MAIIAKQDTYRGGERIPQGTILYEGQVVALETDRSVRIMSDVWADMYYAVVADEEGFHRVGLGNSEFGCDLRAEVDAPEDVQARYRAWKEAREEDRRKRREEARREEARKRAEQYERECKTRIMEPVVGSRVRVVRGRKVPINTEGVVIWRGTDSWGNPRVGLKDDAGEVHWTSARNVERIDVTKPADMTWVAFREHLVTQSPAKGDMVRINADDSVGKVFWKSGSRLGIALSPIQGPDGRYTDVVFVDAFQVTSLEGDEGEQAQAAWDEARLDLEQEPPPTDIEVPF